VTVGIYTFEVHLPGARSLKDKRQVFRRLKDRLRSRYNVAVAESAEHANLWQRGALTLVAVAHDRDSLERMFEAIHRETERDLPGEIVDHAAEFLDARPSGAAGWLERSS
jgi:uncharacterized protein YlxP (DUF503 family)